MPRAFSRKLLIRSSVASLIFMGGAMCFQGLADAQSPAAPIAPVFKMQTDANYRYIESNGVPASAPADRPAVPQNYIFRMPLKPKKSETATRVDPNMFFGVALDGVPITSAANGAGRPLTGGLLGEDGLYTYASIPQALVSKDLSHVGYAADGFPIFVSKSKKFKSSYDQKGNYKPGSGNLDPCNGVTVNGKFYIYVLTEGFPPVPLCWSGSADASFLKRSSPSASASDERGQEQASSSHRGRRRANKNQ